MVRVWLAGTGDGGGVAGIPTGMGVVRGSGLLPAVTPVEAMRVQDQLRRVQFPRDQPGFGISQGRQAGELLGLVPVGS